MADYICPWWLAYTFDNPVRSLFHKPEKIFYPYLKPAMTVADIGCGMGFFSIGLAKILQGDSTVLAIDVQQKMLETARKRAEKAGVSETIIFMLSQGDHLPIDRPLDIALTFWMLHETTDIQSFVAQIHAHLNKDGLLFLAEPKFHVSKKEFEMEVSTAVAQGFEIKDRPNITFSHSVVLEKIPGSLHHTD